MARNPPKFKQQDKYLVICEDSKSSKTYLNEAFKHHRVSNYIQATHIRKTDPYSIVQEAIRSSRAYTKVFCVIDRDRHPRFNEAVAVAANYPNVELILSYPCYEVWFTLHIGYRRKSYVALGKKSAADQLISDLQSSHALFADYSKGDSTEGLYKKIYDEYPLLLKAAFTHADRLWSEYQADGEPNPSTKLHLLLQLIPLLQNPQKLATD